MLVKDNAKFPVVGIDTDPGDNIDHALQSHAAASGPTASDVASIATAYPSRRYYGWYMLCMAMLLAIASSPGQTFGVSVFIEAIRTDLGLTHGQMGLAYTLGTLLGAGPIFWIGHQLDCFGLKRVTLCVLIVFGVACCCMGVVQTWWQIAVAFTLLRMLGPGALSLISSNVLPFWFSRKLGTVEGLRQTAMAIAMAIIPPLNLWLVLQFGWRAAYALLGSLILFVLVPLVMRNFKDRPAELGMLIDGRPPDLLKSCVRSDAPHNAFSSLPQGSPPQGSLPQGSLPQGSEPTHIDVGYSLRASLCTGAFWIVLVGTSLFGMIQTGMFFCLTPIVFEYGMGERHAASMLAIFAMSLAFHQVLGGRLADAVEPKWQLSLGMLGFAGGLACLLWDGDFVGLILAGILLGGAQGIYFSAAHPLWARYYGTRHLGKLRGLLMATNVAVSSLGPLLVGSCFDAFGSFQPALWLFAFLPLPLVFASWFVAPPKTTNEEQAVPR